MVTKPKANAGAIVSSGPQGEPQDVKMAGGKTTATSPTSSGSSSSSSALVNKAAAAAVEEETQPLLLPSTAASASASSNGAATAAPAAAVEAEADPSSSGKQKKKPRLSASDKHALKRLWRETVPPEKGFMTAGVLAMFVSSATNMAFPRLVGQIMDRTTKAAAEKEGSGSGGGESKESTSSLQAFVARALLIFLAGAVGSCVRTHCLRMAKEGTARRLRKKLLRSLLAQEKAFFDDPEGGAHRTGELAAVIEGDVEQAAEVFTTKLADGLRSASSAVNGTAMLLRLSPKLTGVVLGLVPAFTAAIAANVLLTRKLTARQRELQAAAAGFAQERLGNLTTVRAFTAEERDEEAYALLLDEAHALAGRVSLAKGCFMGGLFFAGSATMTAVLYWGGSLAGRGELTGGDLTSFSMYTGLVALGFSGLSSYASDAWRAAVAARRVFDLLDRVPRPPAGSGGLLLLEEAAAEKKEGKRPTGRAKGHIRVTDLYFAYPNRPEVEVLQGVSLEIQPGQVAAIVGASGAGKSTLLALLLGLYAPAKGGIALDGEDVAELDPAWLRQQIGLVEQEPALFTGTIAANIRYGNAEATDEEVEAAARAAGAHEFIAAFPERYATPVGERGRAQLSGGEKQRVTLARALAKDPPVLVLDEATSALDRESEAAVQAALERAVGGRTVIVVAHRLSTVEKADRIFVLSGGKVVESGGFAELMAREDSHFVRLTQAAASTGSLVALASNGVGGAGKGKGKGQ